MTRRPIRPIKEPGILHKEQKKTLYEKIDDNMFVCITIGLGMISYPFIWAHNTLSKIVLRLRK
jgi:hypothetical protein